MAKVIMTGASGGIGQHLSSALSQVHEMIPLSRRRADCHRSFQAGDLSVEPPTPASDVEHLGGSDDQIDWIIHLATTYRVEDDLAMIENLLDFAERHQVPNFLYVSSWVVHFPRRPLSASYIRMKRQCERRLQQSNVPNLRIVRPSVVTGDGLMWTRVLRKLAKFSFLIPGSLTRSFIDVDELSEVIRDVVDGRTEMKIITCLGNRQSLKSKARESLPGAGRERTTWTMILASAAALLLCAVLLISNLAWWGIIGIVGVWLALFRWVPTLLGSISDYFAGFMAHKFEPTEPADVVALCHSSNHNIRVRGYDNASLYFGRPNDPSYTTVGLRRFASCEFTSEAKTSVRAQAGTHFAELLSMLAANGRWLENYPNYHYISVGACVATPVHGSNLRYPFVADLVRSFRYYDRQTDRIHTASRGEPGFESRFFQSQEIGRQVVLSVDLQVCELHHYEFTSRQVPIDRLQFDDPNAFLMQGQHHEIRVNSPWSSIAHLQSYRRQGSEEPARDPRHTKVVDIKADSIGRKWNLLQRNGVLSHSTSLASRAFANFEWFFEPDSFAGFWRQIRRDRRQYPFFKLLIRYNQAHDGFVTAYHNTISVDVTIHNTRAMRERCRELYRQHNPLEHLGKVCIGRRRVNPVPETPLLELAVPSPVVR